MKNLLIITLLLFYAYIPASGNDPETKSGKMIIKIKNVNSSDGKIYVAIDNSSKTFLKEGNFKEVSKNANKGIVVFEIEVPFGEYAVSVYHDENDNNKMDTYMGFIPKEPYGFSNNARGKFGPPSYDDAKVNFEDDGQTLEIVIN
jgi:uncharacterized protein (DUF2141 family)